MYGPPQCGAVWPLKVSKPGRERQAEYFPLCRTPNWLASLCLSRKAPLSDHYISKIF